MSGMRASTGGASERLNVELIPPGMQLCTLYGLIDMGTLATGNYNPSRKVNLAFEFPQHMRVFTEGGESRPASIFSTESLSMNMKSNLRKKYVHLMHKVMTDSEAEAFDISTLLGKSFVATIAHSPDGKWANIQSLTPLTEQNKELFQLGSSTVEQINKTQFFTLDQGFDSENFGQLNNHIKEKIKGSAEGKAHALAGGTFAEYKKDEGSAPNVPGASATKKLVMINQDVSHQSFIDGGWTDQQLVDNGHAKWEEAVAPTVPVTAAPPIVPTTPNIPVTPTTPVVAAVPKLVFNDPSNVLSDWLAQGWTEEMIVEQGHGKIV